VLHVQKELTTQYRALMENCHVLRALMGLGMSNKVRRRVPHAKLEHSIINLARLTNWHVLHVLMERTVLMAAHYAVHANLDFIRKKEPQKTPNRATLVQRVHLTPTPAHMEVCHVLIALKALTTINKVSPRASHALPDLSTT
jgi:hypothetical protein